ncbi:MAG TPA: tyrosine-protein phosphatase [Drouetiella sp.]
MPTQFSTRLLTAMSLVAVSCTAAIAGTVPTEMDGLLNFHEVHPFLYRGGGPSETALRKLKDEKGVKTIIDLRAPSEGKPKASRTKDDDPVQPKEEKKIAEDLGMNYIEMTMDSHAPTKKQVTTFIDEVEKAEKGGGPVYVHCAHGSDRTGCMVGIWRVTHDKWDYDKTYKEMLKYFFTPKFTNLSGAVKQYAEESAH